MLTSGVFLHSLYYPAAHGGQALIILYALLSAAVAGPQIGVDCAIFKFMT